MTSTSSSSPASGGVPQVFVTNSSTNASTAGAAGSSSNAMTPEAAALLHQQRQQYIEQQQQQLVLQQQLLDAHRQQIQQRLLQLHQQHQQEQQRQLQLMQLQEEQQQLELEQQQLNRSSSLLQQRRSESPALSNADSDFTFNLSLSTTLLTTNPASSTTYPHSFTPSSASLTSAGVPDLDGDHSEDAFGARTGRTSLQRGQNSIRPQSSASAPFVARSRSVSRHQTSRNSGQFTQHQQRRVHPDGGGGAFAATRTVPEEPIAIPTPSIPTDPRVAGLAASHSLPTHDRSAGDVADRAAASSRSTGDRFPPVYNPNEAATSMAQGRDDDVQTPTVVASDFSAAMRFSPRIPTPNGTSIASRSPVAVTPPAPVRSVSFGATSTSRLYESTASGVASPSRLLSGGAKGHSFDNVFKGGELDTTRTGGPAKPERKKRRLWIIAAIIVIVAVVALAVGVAVMMLSKHQSADPTPTSGSPTSTTTTTTTGIVIAPPVVVVSSDSSSSTSSPSSISSTSTLSSTDSATTSSDAGSAPQTSDPPQTTAAPPPTTTAAPPTTTSSTSTAIQTVSVPNPIPSSGPSVKAIDIIARNTRPYSIVLIWSDGNGNPSPLYVFSAGETRTIHTWVSHVMYFRVGNSKDNNGGNGPIVGYIQITSTMQQGTSWVV
ncbi:hypothetical protein DFJ73DRAFT_804134 [Zopfochytrium polystomum]|nr:hypothetical protein DFJ73DRAFT_804134 [Zopfochytrium polystomum]